MQLMVDISGLVDRECHVQCQWQRVTEYVNIGWSIHETQLRNLPNPTWEYTRGQTIAEEEEKCVDEGLEPTYYLTIFMMNKQMCHILFLIKLQLVSTYDIVNFQLFQK